MKKIGFFLVVITLLISISLGAQEVNDPEEQKVLEVFELFFDSMKQRDTATLKNIILSPSPYNHFWQATGADSSGLLATSSSSLKGVMKTVGNPDGLMGKCNNEFEYFSVEIYERYAVVSAKYKCLVNGQIDNCGKYTVQFLKSDHWKIREVFRYVTRQDCSW